MNIGIVGDADEVVDILSRSNDVADGFTVVSFVDLVLNEVESGFGLKASSIPRLEMNERQDSLALSLATDNLFRRWLGPEITNNVPVYCKSNTPHELFCLWYDYYNETRPGRWSRIIMEVAEGAIGPVVVTGLCGRDEISTLKGSGFLIWMVPPPPANLSGNDLHDTDEFVQLFIDADVTFLSRGDDLVDEISYKLGEASASSVRENS